MVIYVYKAQQRSKNASYGHVFEIYGVSIYPCRAMSTDLIAYII